MKKKILLLLISLFSFSSVAQDLQLYVPMNNTIEENSIYYQEQSLAQRVPLASDKVEWHGNLWSGFYGIVKRGNCHLGHDIDCDCGCWVLVEVQYKSYFGVAEIWPVYVYSHNSSNHPPINTPVGDISVGVIILFVSLIGAYYLYLKFK